MQKIKTSDWAINPAFVFLVLWSTQVIGHIVFRDSFDAFLSTTWWIVAAGIIAFLTGCMFSAIFCKKKNKPNFIKNTTLPSFIGIYLRILLPIYIFTVIFPEVFNLMSKPSLALADIRAAMVDSVIENDRGVILILYVHYSVVFASLLTLSYASELTKPMAVYAASVGLIAGVMTFGRTILLLYFVSAGVTLYIQGLISKRTSFVIGLLFIVAFFAMAFFMGKGGVDNGVFENIMWNFKVYILAGIAAFNGYILSGQPDVPGLLLIPNFLKDFLSAFGTIVESTPNVLPFVETPLPTNVYTALFPWYHDGGILGIVFGFGVIGFASTYLFDARYNSRTSLFLYSISLYPLIMMVFEEQYFRAYTLWVLALLLVVVVKVVEKFDIRKLSRQPSK